MDMSTTEKTVQTLSPAAEAPSDTALLHLGQMQARLHGLHAQATEAHLPSAERLGRSLKELIKWLAEKPENGSATSLEAAESAVALLDELCQNRSQVNLGEPPIRILAVDDDAINRRAIASAIQLVFGMPETVDSGEAAVALARDKTYDLIFMDIMMPGIDGYEACEEILRSEPNRETPVVFVTSRADQESREKAKLAGGSGFITKPILSKEILVTALTFTLRGRLKRQAPHAETVAA
jgi:CheY-like chemotaxis protein